ncbi:MAG: glycosyltransferase [Clostridia bacterium]|nr:glycosyltransferase [Clostridia bacterium]
MKILFVVNNFYIKGNGLSTSAQRTVLHLRKRGLDVRILSAKNPESDGVEPEYRLENIKIPVFDRIVRKQGYIFAKTDKKIIRDAVSWADIIHLEEPFLLQVAVADIAAKMHKPCVATYHLHPENLYASINLENEPFINNVTLLAWKKAVFDKCVIVQCPTENAEKRLKENNFKAKLKVISNGLAVEQLKKAEDIEKKRFSSAAFTVTAIGRHSKEKDPFTILRSMRFSKYAKDIQLVFAGRGPKTESLKKFADRLIKRGVLRFKPIFDFYSFDELQTLAASSDLYIHAAFIEVEGLSCLEAIRTGVVPVIAETRYSATSQFALSEMSKFKAKDPKDLAKKIDYWLSDPVRRAAEAEKYKGFTEKYDIEKSIDGIIEMYYDAYFEYYHKKTQTNFTKPLEK